MIIVAAITGICGLGALVLLLGIDGAVVAAIIGILGGLLGAVGGYTASSYLGNRDSKSNALDIEASGLLKGSYARAKRQFRKIQARMAASPAYFGDSKSKRVFMASDPTKIPLIWDD